MEAGKGSESPGGQAEYAIRDGVLEVVNTNKKGTFGNVKVQNTHLYS